MMHETGCPPATSKTKLRFESVSFAGIPGQTELFLRYQSDPLSLTKYYPGAVASHVDVASRVGDVLDAYVVDRDALCRALREQNVRFGAGAETLRSIEMLESNDTVAVLTGQQAGLFTGPLYTVYKALSAVRMAACLRGRGINAVPVFWAATEDHDFDEISKAFVLDGGAEQVVFELDRADKWTDVPVGKIPISDSFQEQLRNGLQLLPSTDFSASVSDSLTEIWKPGRTIGEAFCSHLLRLFGKLGLIVVDPLDPAIKNLAAPIYAEAARRSTEIVDALLERSSELKADGFESQVLVTPDYFPLFYHPDDGARRSIRQTSKGTFRISETKEEFSRDQLVEIAENDPDRLSPGVMLRPVVQDYLFPTVCYFGGGAEISYFAQNSEVYRVLGRPATTILHRQSYTVIEAKQARTLEKYELDFQELFNGLDGLLPGIVQRFVNPSTSHVFADAEEKINAELHRLDTELVAIDPTLAANLATRRRKIVYHLAALQKKFHRVQIERDEIVNRQLLSLFASVLPGGRLQERTLNVESFIQRYGSYFIDWVYDSIDLEERDHRLLYL